MRETATIINILYSCNNEGKKLFHSVRQLMIFMYRSFYLILSNNIALRFAYHPLQNYLFKDYKIINHHFEKPRRSLFCQYQIAPLPLHLKQWLICNEHESMALTRYAEKPRNPE